MNTEQSADLSDICIICMSIRIANNFGTQSLIVSIQRTKE